ncbi:MAG: hypothetical protein ACRDK7_02735 [Solirubrobacteraceae bacterium]
MDLADTIRQTLRSAFAKGGVRSLDDLTHDQQFRLADVFHVEVPELHAVMGSPLRSTSTGRGIQHRSGSPRGTDRSLSTSPMIQRQARERRAKSEIDGEIFADPLLRAEIAMGEYRLGVNVTGSPLQRFEEVTAKLDVLISERRRLGQLDRRSELLERSAANLRKHRLDASGRVSREREVRGRLATQRDAVARAAV